MFILATVIIPTKLLIKFEGNLIDFVLSWGLKQAKFRLSHCGLLNEGEVKYECGGINSSGEGIRVVAG